LAQWHTHGITPAILQKASLALDAPWIKTKLTMHHNPEEAFPTTALDLSLDAGAAFRLLRPLNLLPSNLNHLSGHLALTSTLRPAEAKRLHAICSLTSKALSCAYDGKTVTLSPALTADILFDPTQPLAAEIRQLKANAPGIAINGSGTLTNGALSVGFQSAPFWTAFAPLIGNYPLQYPVEATFEIRALSQQVEASLALHNANTRLGEATLKVDAFNPLDYTFKTLKLNTSWHLSPLAKVVGGLPETASLSGDLYANLAATGALNNLTANLAFSLQNIALATTAWSIREPLLAEGRSTLTLKEKQLTATNITLSSPIMTLLGNAQAHFEEHFPISADLKGTLSPSKVFKDWRIWGKNETPFKLDGTIDYTITAEKPNATLSLQTDLLSDTFTILPDKADAIPLPFNLNVNLLQSPSQLQLNACTFAMKGLSLTSTGAFCPDTGLLAIKGQLTPDFDTLFATLPPLAKQRDTFAVSGKHTRDFSFEAPLLQGLPGIFNYGKAAAELCFDTVTVPGLDIPQGLVSLTLQDGVVALNGDVQVNGGRVFIQPRLNLSGDTPVLFWKEQGKVLDNVHLTQALFDTALGGINPLLAGSANPSGSISLTCNHLYLPLTERFLSDLEASILLETNACQLKPNGAVQKVLAIVAKNDESLRLDDQKIALSITEGNLKADPITIRVENLKFICQGQTNLLTQAIHYTLTVPLNEKLVGKSLAKSIKAGETVTLPITGTIQKPQLDTSPLVQVFTETAVNRAKDKLSNKLERALQKRVTKQKAKPSSSSKASPKKDTDALEDALRSLFGN
ncbi:MAG: hypothetical protein IJV69_04635, partial [Kiritimatiellae bacterium]|nr:hypothetical protein [Kiritimatiellia bacterium]